jgi:hypothetical protein
MYNLRKLTQVKTNASNYALGAILTQQGEDKK